MMRSPAGSTETNASVDNAPSEFSYRRQILFAFVIIASLIFGVAGWAAKATLTGAVIAPGMFVVERNVKKVQHSYGGIVSEINVKNGDRVEAGQIVLRLDPVQVQAEIGVINSQILEIKARSARLVAERDGHVTVQFPPGFVEQGADAAIAAAGELRLFNENRQAKEGQKEQLRLRIAQFGEEIIGLTAQRDAKQGELSIIQKELAIVRELQAKRITTASRVYALERESTRLGGELGGLIAQIARVRGQINEVNVQILSIDENAKAQAQRDLRTIEGKLGELTEREVAARDRLNRIDIRAPRSGIVHELAIHTVGGVATAAEQLMLIVPEEEALTVQARIMPINVDQVVVGRPARLRLSAFNQQITPELTGQVVQVAADVTLDAKSGQSYYVVRLEMDEKSRNIVGGLKLVPGMPVEVFILTGERTPLSYLAKPFTDQMTRAFRE